MYDSNREGYTQNPGFQNHQENDNQNLPMNSVSAFDKEVKTMQFEGDEGDSYLDSGIIQPPEKQIYVSHHLHDANQSYQFQDISSIHIDANQLNKDNPGSQNPQDNDRNQNKNYLNDELENFDFKSVKLFECQNLENIIHEINLHNDMQLCNNLDTDLYAQYYQNDHQSTNRDSQFQDDMESTKEQTKQQKMKLVKKRKSDLFNSSSSAGVRNQINYAQNQEQDKVGDHENQLNLSKFIITSSLKKGNLGQVAVIFNLFKSFVGVGILALPHTFQLVGVVGGSIGIFIIAIVSMYTMLLQIPTKQKLGNKYETVTDLSYALFGKNGKLIIELLFATGLLGSCAAYLVFISKQFDQIILFVIMYYSIGNLSNQYETQEQSGMRTTFQQIKMLDVANLPLFFGIALYAFDSSTIVLTMHKASNSPKNFEKTFKLVMITVMIMCITFAAIGYSSFVYQLLRLLKNQDFIYMFHSHFFPSLNEQ
eukprot:403376658